MKNSTPYLLIISIISIALAALLFFLLSPGDDHRRFDFIQRFDEAIKTGFDNGKMIDTYLPDRVFIFDRRLLTKNAAALLSGDDFITLKNISSSAFNRQVIGDGCIRLSFTDMPNLKSDFVFRIKKKNNREFWNINLTAASGTGSIIITKVTGRETVEIASFEYRLKPGVKNALTSLFFDDYLVLFNEKDILFQKKCASLLDSGRITLNVKSNHDMTPRYTVKLAEVPGKAKEILLASMTERFALVREHQIDITGKKRVWNVLSDRKYLKLENGTNPFLRRLKRKLETRPVIYFRMNSSLKYEMTFPGKPILSFALAAVPKYIIDPKKIIFSARVESYDSGKIKEVDISLDNLANGIDRFNRFGYKLDDFVGQKCVVEFTLRTKDGKLEGDERHIMAALGSPLLTGAREEKERNVILISLDTLRADRLGCYGCDRETSPNIDRLAREGTLFLNAASNSNWTLPSHMSIFTGVYPYETGFVKGDEIHSQSYMSDILVPLAQYLKNRDYLTLGVHGGGFVSEGYGFDRGFDLYYKAGKDAAKGVGDTIMLLEKYSERKFFLFFHTFEIHDPYTRGYFVDRLLPSASRLDKIIAAYDSGIRYTDKQLGRLFEWLRKKDVYDNTLIIITSDHGENFDILNERKNCGSHGQTLYDPETRIPLIIGGVAEFADGSIVSSQVSTVDILPTVLSYLGIDQRNEIRGRSLYSGEKLGELKERPAYSEAVHTQIESKSLRSPERKLIANIPGKKAKIPESFTPYEFYDLKTDPKEKSNIWEKKTKTALNYRNLLHRIMNSVERNRFRIMKNIKKGFIKNEELEQDLRNLGYLGN